MSEMSRRPHRNEDNYAKMEQWEVNFLQLHFCKHVALKIRIKYQNVTSRSTKYMPILS